MPLWVSLSSLLWNGVGSSPPKSLPLPFTGDQGCGTEVT